MVPGTGPQVTGFTDAVAVVPGQSPAAAFAPVLGQLLLFKELGDALGDDPFLLPDRRQFVVVAEAFEVVVEQVADLVGVFEVLQVHLVRQFAGIRQVVDRLDRLPCLLLQEQPDPEFPKGVLLLVEGDAQEPVDEVLVVGEGLELFTEFDLQCEVRLVVALFLGNVVPPFQDVRKARVEAQQGRREVDDGRRQVRVLGQELLKPISYMPRRPARPAICWTSSGFR